MKFVFLVKIDCHLFQLFSYSRNNYSIYYNDFNVNGHIYDGNSNNINNEANGNDDDNNNAKSSKDGDWVIHGNIFR